MLDSKRPFFTKSKETGEWEASGSKSGGSPFADIAFKHSPSDSKLWIDELRSSRLKHGPDKFWINELTDKRGSDYFEHEYSLSPMSSMTGSATTGPKTVTLDDMKIFEDAVKPKDTDLPVWDFEGRLSKKMSSGTAYAPLLIEGHSPVTEGDLVGSW